MKKITFLLILLISPFAFSQTFNWESSVDHGISVTETLNGITATVTTSNSDAQIVNGIGFEGSSGNIVFTQYSNSSSSMTITFSEPVDIASIFTFIADGDSGGDSSIVFTPTGGTNSVVTEGVSQTAGEVVTLNWTGITVITLTASGGGNETFGIDDMVVNTDITSPVFENSTPSSASITNTSFTLNTDINEAGTIYYVVVADGATAPTATEVKAGTGNAGSSAVTSGNTAVNTGNFTNAFSVIGLSSSTNY